MGSPLGPCFANFYMGELETETFKNENIKPHIYCRYVDDIFIQVKSDEELIAIKNKFENKSALTFTFEKSIEKKLPFLDVLVDINNNKFKTNVYRKTTNKGFCINADGECIDRYKNSVISSYVSRAFKITTTWKDFHNECQHFKQLLVNNNFTNKMVDQQINKLLTQKLDKNIAKKKIKLIYFTEIKNTNIPILTRKS